MNDWNTLVRFARLLGLSVRTSNPGTDDSGEFVYQGKRSYIRIFSKKRDTDAVLVLLHELGHALDWVNKGRPHHSEIPSALLVEERELTKAERRTLYEYELAAIKNMSFIHRLLNLRLPLYLMERERRFDLWIAESLLKNTQLDTELKDQKSQEKRQERMQRYRQKYYAKLCKQITKKTVSRLSLI